MADAWGGSWGTSWGLSWGGGSSPPPVVEDRGDAYFPRTRQSRAQYNARKREYYAQLQEELNRRLAPEPEPVKAKPQRKAKPAPIVTTPIVAGEAARIVETVLNAVPDRSQQELRTALLAYAAQLAERQMRQEQEDEDDAVAVLLAVM